MANEILVYKDCTHVFQATLTSGGSTWDISAVTEITLTVKTEKGDGISAEFTLTKTGGDIAFATDGTDGVINITFDNSETANIDIRNYVYDIRVILSGESYTPLEGVLTVEDTVT